MWDKVLPSPVWREKNLGVLLDFVLNSLTKFPGLGLKTVILLAQPE